MLHASARAVGWTSALLALVDSHATPRREPQSAEPDLPTEVADQNDDEREPFHLDDTELATRLVRDRGLLHYSTPPHTHLIFPSQPVQ